MAYKINNKDIMDWIADYDGEPFDAILCDPPYELGFMGKSWDSTGIAFNVEMWRGLMMHLKPGGHLLAFSGSRTYHRMAVAIEDAGFEIRDMIEWVYGSGFPKSLNVGKSVNQLESNEWTKISKALDNLQITDIIRIWKSNSNNVNIVAELSQRQATAAGTHTDLNDSVLLRVVLPTSQEKQNTSADTVGIALSVHQATHTRISTVLQNVVAEIKRLQEPVKFAEKSLQSLNHKHSTTSTVQESVKDTPSENTANKIRVEEALKTLRGKRKYSDEETINVLCAVLTENLLHTILSQSKTFQNLDTTSKTECVSAITVTITEYTAECLTTYTVDIAKSKAVDKIQGNEREDLGKHPQPGKAGKTHTRDGGAFKDDIRLTKGNSAWEGYGTALKPAHESVCVAQKPLETSTETEYIISICQKLFAQIATNRSMLNPQEQKEVSSIVQWLAENNINTLDDLSEAMAILQSCIKGVTSLNIVWSWLITLAESWQAMNTFTISTRLNMTTELKILDSLEWASILRSIMLPKNNKTDGLSASVYNADSLLNAARLKLQDTLTHFADESAISKAGNQGLLPRSEPCVLARKPLEGTVANNVLKHGTGGLNIDGTRVGTTEKITNHSRGSESAISKGKYGDSSAQETHQTQGQQLGRFPANLILSTPEDEYTLKSNLTPEQREQAKRWLYENA